MYISPYRPDDPRPCLRHNTLPNIILQGTVDGSRRTGRPRHSWKDNNKEWSCQSMSSLLHIADGREVDGQSSHLLEYPRMTPGRHGYQLVSVGLMVLIASALNALNYIYLTTNQ